MKAALRSRTAYGTKKQPEPETEQRAFIAEYDAMISNIDHNVGRILGHLDRLGIAENTMGVFFADPAHHGAVFS